MVRGDKTPASVLRFRLQKSLFSPSIYYLSFANWPVDLIPLCPHTKKCITKGLIKTDLYLPPANNIGLKHANDERGKGVSYGAKDERFTNADRLIYFSRPPVVGCSGPSSVI